MTRSKSWYSEKPNPAAPPADPRGRPLMYNRSPYHSHPLYRMKIRRYPRNSNLKTVPHLKSRLKWHRTIRISKHRKQPLKVTVKPRPKAPRAARKMSQQVKAEHLRKVSRRGSKLNKI